MSNCPYPLACPCDTTRKPIKTCVPFTRSLWLLARWGDFTIVTCERKLSHFEHFARATTCRCTDQLPVSAGLSGWAAPFEHALLHQPGEFVEVDPSVAVQIGCLDHAPDLVVRQRLAQVVHCQLKLLRRDQAIAVPVKHAERVHNVFLALKTRRMSRLFNFAKKIGRFLFFSMKPFLNVKAVWIYSKCCVILACIH